MLRQFKNKQLEQTRAWAQKGHSASVRQLLQSPYRGRSNELARPNDRD
jgi:hypothetical protein